jgi:cell division septal protein FtsQ
MVSHISYKKIKKDYQHKNFNNPFFHKKNKGAEAKRWRWLLIAIILLILTAIWFIFAAPLWRLEEINVSGLTRVSDTELRRVINDEMQNRRGLLFTEKNIFLFRSAAATENILAAYNFSGAEITKKLPRALEVKVTERPYSFIFQEGSNYYYASSDAYIIKDPAVAEEDKTRYLVLENKNFGTMITASEKINVASDYLNFVLDLSRRLAAYPELAVEKFIIDQEFNTIKVKFISGPIVFFNTKEEAGLQVNRLWLVKKEKIKDNFSRTNYIDLRYGDKIFVNPDFN